MIEKPPPEKAPSEFAIIGRHVLAPEIFEKAPRLRRHALPDAGEAVEKVFRLELVMHSILRAASRDVRFVYRMRRRQAR